MNREDQENLFVLLLAWLIVIAFFVGITGFIEDTHAPLWISDTSIPVDAVP